MNPKLDRQNLLLNLKHFHLNGSDVRTGKRVREPHSSSCVFHSFTFFFMKMYFDCTIIAKIYQYCTILQYRGAEFQAEARKSHDCGFNKKGPL